MLVGQIIDLFHDIDLSEIRTDLQNVHTHWVDESFTISQNIQGIEIDLVLNIKGRNFNRFSLSDVFIIDLKVWLNDAVPEVISDGSLIRIEKILKRKVIEL